MNRPRCRQVLDCASALARLDLPRESGGAPPQSKTLARLPAAFGSWSRCAIPKPRRLPLLLGFAALATLSAGCANVKPWDRDALAHYSMRPDRDPVTLSLREHMWFSREASNGGRSVGGGGCGCN